MRHTREARFEARDVLAGVRGRLVAEARNERGRRHRAASCRINRKEEAKDKKK